MDAIGSTSSFAATIKYSTDKTCFLTVHNKWLKDIHSDLPVFKVIYGKRKKKKTAYVSCSRELSRWTAVESKVFMNEKFAKHLSLMEGDTVELQAVSISIPMALNVEIEPLSSSDWEILKLNSDYITDKLINQIRIIWVNLIFPVWVESNCIYCKVVTCEPNYEPVMLQEGTEFRVVPKDRDSSPSHLNNDLQKEKESNYLQFQRLRIYSKSEHPEIDDSEEVYGSLLESDVNIPSLAAYAPQFLTWFLSPKEEKTSLEEPECFNEIYDYNFDSVLRVIPFTNPEMTMPHVIQSTTVFINAGTYLKCCGGTEIPPCFVGVLEKYLLPDKKPKKNISEPLKNNGSDNTNTLTKNGNKNKLEIDDGQKPFDSICVTVMVVKSAEEDEFHLPTRLFTYENAIIVPQELKKALNVEVASQVHLKNVTTKPLLAYKIIFHPVTLLSLEITEKVIHEQFRLWAFMNNRKHHTFVISNGTFVKLKIHGKKNQFFIRLEERDLSKNGDSPMNSLDTDKKAAMENDNEVYGLLTQKILKRTPIKIGSTMCATIYDDRIFLIRESAMYCDVKAAKLKELGGIKKLETNAVEGIEFWLKLRPLSYISSHSSTYSGCILICGPKGVGKSAFAAALCKKFANHPYHVLVRIVQCLALKGKRVDTIAKKWNELVSEAIHGQPSILLFEDLDYIAAAPVSYEQENGPDGVYYSSISQAFIGMMNRVVSSQSKIVVMATSNSRHSLHPSLVNTKGRHIFQSILEVNPPNVQQRAEILVALMIKRSHISFKKSIKQADILDIALKTEGYVAQDLNTLVDRATHAAWMRLASCQEGDTIALINKDFEVALKGLVPSSLRGVSLQMQDQRTWKDVGGLTKVKKVIQQIIMWPTKYKEIYKNYSLKPQTNILLYGAPGTGKTLLAGVVASECGLNFISIKGPELLSKYIGASEQAVRDLFQRATAAKPCILFFDEFDSIAPRRGHDSTGVTDRVVNQLLTQLDGVESLEGVHVLAATSRPELIDPALLRPGRLDKCLLCPLPDQNERVEILKCLSLKLPLCEDVNFENIASMTENFSGADLQALLYTAHIEALHEIQQSSTTCYGGSSEDQDYKRASARLLFIPNLVEGLKNPSDEDGKKIVQEAAVIQDNFFGVRGKESRRHSTLVVSINQKHLLKVANEMKPSVSFEERIRYQTVFKDFQNVLSGESAALPRYDKKVTLA